MVTSDEPVNMQKWGIPEDEMVSAQVTLLERLVWVPYMGHWWPALLYDTYTELQDHMYKKLDVVSKAQFATAIMRQLNDPKPIKIARLLGREVLEVIEVEKKEYAEFYGQLPKVLPMSCRKSQYGNDTKRYLDFHRALDQVEEIIRDISNNSSRPFNLVPGAEKKTWLQRAKEALEEPNATSSINAVASIPGEGEANSIRMNNLKRKEAADEEEYNFLFAALDGVMDQCNSTYDCVSGKVEEKIAEEPIENRSHMLAITKQRETRASLRKALARQRQIREAGSVAHTNNCIADDDAREGTDSVMVTSPSTDVLPATSGEDTSLWNLLNSNTRDEDQPDMTAVPPKKILVQPVQRVPSHPTKAPIDSREEYPEDHRQAIIASARAAAAVDLEVTFWDHLTCNVTEY